MRSEIVRVALAPDLSDWAWPKIVNGGLGPGCQRHGVVALAREAVPLLRTVGGVKGEGVLPTGIPSTEGILGAVAVVTAGRSRTLSSWSRRA